MHDKNLLNFESIELLTAKLCDLAYKSTRKYKNGQIIFKDYELSCWKYYQPEKLPCELRCKIFTAINNKSKHVVIVLKGSEPLPSFDIEEIVNDWCITDLNLVIGRVPKQFYEAYEYLQLIKADYKDFNIFITGHSLGGSIVQLLCSLEENNHIEGYTYNAYGARHLLPALEKINLLINKEFSNINNFLSNADFVANHNEHIGNVYIVKYEKHFIQTIFCIISELPKILTDIPFKIIKSIKYYINVVKWFFIKIDAHLMNNFTNGFKQEKDINE